MGQKCTEVSLNYQKPPKTIQWLYIVIPSCSNVCSVATSTLFHLKMHQLCYVYAGCVHATPESLKPRSLETLLVPF